MNIEQKSHYNADNTEEMIWQGPGWYAPCQEFGRTRYFHVGYDESEQPDVYTMGLGTPSWYDECPF